MATRKAGSRLETEIERCRTECQWERIPELVKQLSAKLIANGTLGRTGAAGPRRPPGLGPRRGARAGARPGGEAQAARCARARPLGNAGSSGHAACCWAGGRWRRPRVQACRTGRLTDPGGQGPDPGGFQEVEAGVCVFVCVWPLDMPIGIWGSPECVWCVQGSCERGRCKHMVFKGPGRTPRLGGC